MEKKLRIVNFSPITRPLLQIMNSLLLTRIEAYYGGLVL